MNEILDALGLVVVRATEATLVLVGLLAIAFVAGSLTGAVIAIWRAPK